MDLTWTGLALDLDLYRKRPAAECISYGTDHIYGAELNRVNFLSAAYGSECVNVYDLNSKNLQNSGHHFTHSVSVLHASAISAVPSPFSKKFGVHGITHNVYRMSGVCLNYV